MKTTPTIAGNTVPSDMLVETGTATSVAATPRQPSISTKIKNAFLSLSLFEEDFISGILTFNNPFSNRQHTQTSAIKKPFMSGLYLKIIIVIYLF